MSKSVLCVCVCVCVKLTVLIRAVSSYKSRPVQTSRIQGFLCCCQADRVFLGLLLLFLPLPAAVLCCFFGGVFSFSIHKFKIKMLIVLCSQILNISFFFFFLNKNRLCFNLSVKQHLELFSTIMCFLT